MIATRDASDSDSRSQGQSKVGSGTLGSGQNGQPGSGGTNAGAVTNMNELTKGIRREVTRLSERWAALLMHTNQWQAKLDDMLPVG